MKRPESLQVIVDGKRRYITVPSGYAAELHAYLRSHSVMASPPAPSFTGFDTIELAGSCNAGAIQNLVNSWLQASMPQGDGSSGSLPHGSQQAA